MGQASAKRTLCVALHNHLVRLRTEEAAAEARAQHERARACSAAAAAEAEKERARERERECERERNLNGHYEILSDWVGQKQGATAPAPGAERQVVLTGELPAVRPEAYADERKAQEQVEFFSSAMARAVRSAPRASTPEVPSEAAPAPRAPRRRPAPVADDVPLPRPNVMLLGPSGSGKTLLLSTLARGLNLPFLHVDATPLTQAGYVGEDAENIVARLLAAAGGDARRAGMGIVVIDEVVSGRAFASGRRTAH